MAAASAQAQASLLAVSFSTHLLRIRWLALALVQALALAQ
jgi:hypothetical protein